MEINSTKINTFIFDCFGVICGSAFFSWYKENMLKYGNTDSKLLEVFKEHDLGRFPEEDVAEYFSKYEGSILMRLLSETNSKSLSILEALR